jgi:hypothetical protein
MVNMDPAIIALIVFVPVFLAFWYFATVFIAVVSGWRELARVYPSEHPIIGAAEWRNRRGRMRYGSGYNGCLNIAANAMGMQLSVWSIFRPGHPPLFIPWSEIRTEPVHGMFVESVRFSFLRATTPLLLGRDLAEEVLRSAPGVRSPAWHTSPPRSSSSTR